MMLRAAVAACDPDAVQKTVEPVVERKYREEGLWGVKPVLAEIERACAGKPQFARALGFLYFLGVDYAGQHGDCGYF